MADVVFVLVVVAFFALAAGFVAVCDRIVRSDDTTSDPAASNEVLP